MASGIASATHRDRGWTPVVAWSGVLVAAVAYFLYAAWPSLVDPYVLNNDLPQHLLWLYPADWGDSFYPATAELIQPWGYAGLTRALTWLVSVDTLTRYGPLLSLLLTVGFGYGLLRRYFSWAIAIGGALLIGHLSYPPAVGFFSRAFCVPVLLAFGYYWLRRKDWGVVAALLAAALFYPPALLIQGGLLGVYCASDLFNSWRKGVVEPSRRYSRDQRPARNGAGRRWLLLLGAALLSGGLVLVKTAQLHGDARIGPFVAAEEIRADPEFGAGGRVNFRQELKTTTAGMLRYSLHKNLQWPAAPWSYYLGGLLWAALAWWQRRTPLAHFDRWMVLLLLSCCFWHWQAQLWVPRLFVPDRFLSYPGHLLAGLLVVRLLGGLTPRRVGWLAGGGLLLLQLGYLYFTRPIPWESLTGYGALRDVYTAVAELPPRAKVAAPPWVADMVPVFARRSVLLSNESAHALYFRGYRNEITERWQDFVTAYTAHPDEGALLQDFLRKHNITHLLIDELHLRERKFLAFQPYADRYEIRTAARSPTDYLLLQLPPEMGTLLADRYRLVAATVLMTWLATLPPAAAAEN